MTVSESPAMLEMGKKTTNSFLHSGKKTMCFCLQPPPLDSPLSSNYHKMGITGGPHYLQDDYLQWEVFFRVSDSTVVGGREIP